MTDVVEPNRELRHHPGWWARLEGALFDLEGLSAALGDQAPVQVRKFDGRYYMRMDEFDLLNESGMVDTRAREVLRVLNGAARVQYGRSRELRVEATVSVSAAGEVDQ